tara:strand:+ start:106 stop:351 length:246 start_codon:yes stop_codon:yes gene_type:complete
MPLFRVKYSEVQTRAWYLTIETETSEEARKIFEGFDDIWTLEDRDSRVEWDGKFPGADGEAVDTLESEIEVDDTPMIKGAP